MKKFFYGLAIAAALLLLVTGTVFAQEPAPSFSGTVQTITVETDEVGVTTVIVELLDEAGEVQSVRISLETALELGLVAPELVETYVVVDAALGTTLTLNPEDVLEVTEEDTDDESLHPVGSALSEFFSSLLGVDYDTLMTYHDDGMGFGTIAQAFWMTKALEGDTATFQLILDAKKSGDYSTVVLPDGSTPSNWGQFRKAVLSDKEKAKNNLGVIRSDKAEDDSEDEMNLEFGNPDKEKKNKDKSKGNGKDN
jgi:hypothetical protein